MSKPHFKTSIARAIRHNSTATVAQSRDAAESVITCLFNDGYIVVNHKVYQRILDVAESNLATPNREIRIIHEEPEAMQ